MIHIRTKYLAPITLLVAICVLFLPAALLYFRVASSFTLGISIVCAVLTFFYCLQCIIVKRFKVRLIHLRKFAILYVLAFFLILHTYFIILLSQPFDFGRAALLFVPLFTLMLGSVALAHLVCRLSDGHVNFLISFLSYIIIAIIIFNLLELTPLAESYFKPIFPFNEPSLFGLTVFPFLIFWSVILKGWKRIALLSLSLAYTFYIQNLTMVGGIMLASLLSLRVTHILLLILFLFLVTPFLDLEYFTQRLVLSADSTNLSVLVYLQGWSLLIDSFTSSFGVGVGFQQLGIQSTDLAISNKIYEVLSDVPNLRDGGFVVAKLVSEFGIVGILILVIYFAYFCRAAKYLRHIANKGLTCVDSRILMVFCCACVCSLSIELFLRGVGYTTSSILLSMASIIVLSKNRALVLNKKSMSVELR